MKHRRTIHAPLFRPALCLIVGLALAYGVRLPLAGLTAVFVLAVATTVALRRHAVGQSVAICLCFVLLGGVLMTREQQRQVVGWPGDGTAVEVVVASEPWECPRSMGMEVLLADGGQRLRCYVAKDERSRRIAVGDGLLVRGRGQYVPAHQWQWRQVSLKGVPRVERVRLRFLKYRHRLLERYRAQGVTDEAYAVVAAMTLGDKSTLTPALKEVYNVSGASHVLALSGLHLGIVYALLSLLIVGRRLRVVMQVLAVLAMWAFALLVGLSPSVVRSATMLSVYGVLSLGWRNRAAVNVLCFTVMVMLVASPMALFDVGFQMSFMSMLAILVFYPLFYGLLPVAYLQAHPAVRWLWGMTGVSLAAQLGAAPLIAYYFGRISTLSLLTNFVVVPAATVVLYLSLAVLLLPFLTPLSWLLVAVVRVLNAVLATVASWPIACIEGLHPSLVQVAMVYVIMAAGYLLVVRLHQK